MSHLSLETIARLVDEQPSPLDNAHLTGCAACRAELEDMRSDVASLGALAEMQPSADSWNRIEARLEAEGLLHSSTHIGPAKTRSYTLLARAAAVAAIFMSGALVGHALQSSKIDTPQVADNTTRDAGTTVNPNTTTDSPMATSDANATPADSRRSPAESAGGPVRLAATGNARRADVQRNTPSEPESEAATLRSLRDAEDRYFKALQKYSAGSPVTNDPTARLAALEGIVLTTRAALAQAPTDPVINGYHLTALAQRDAMLKQIKGTPATSW
ncbi:MAG: hypothetical protein ABIV28_05175 [Longimicrobiales bacterium]